MRRHRGVRKRPAPKLSTVVTRLKCSCSTGLTNCKVKLCKLFKSLVEGYEGVGDKRGGFCIVYASPHFAEIGSSDRSCVIGSSEIKRVTNSGFVSDFSDFVVTTVDAGARCSRPCLRAISGRGPLYVRHRGLNPLTRLGTGDAASGFAEAFCDLSRIQKPAPRRFHLV